MSYEPTIFVVDDNKEVTEAITWLIKSVGYIVKSYENAIEFLENYKPEQPGCLVLDVRMPGMSGLELQKTLVDRDICIPIIFITAHGDIDMAVSTMKQGAVDFLTKPVNNQALLDAINKAITQDQHQREDKIKKAAIVKRAQLLTPREREVMGLMVAGKPTKVIASDLGISPNTVELHRAKVMEKMQVKRLAELVGVALKYKIVEID